MSETIDHFDDALDRTESFTSDLVGNPLWRVVDLAATQAMDQVFASTYDANDRLQTETLDQDNNGTVDQTTTYDWGVSGADADGGTQQLGKTVRDAAGFTTSRQLLSYNLQGQLGAAVNESFDGTGTLTGRTRVAYAYDPAGLRNLATEAADADLNGAFTSAETLRATEYLFDAHSLTGLPQVLTETEKNAAGHAVQHVSYTFGLDEIAQTVAQLEPATGTRTSSQTHTFAHDGHGSVRVLVDAATALVQAYTYSAYGELLAIHNAAGVLVSSSAADALTNRLYSGETFDARTGWQFLRARWYRPETGRFEHLDPFAGAPQAPFTFHKYAYTSGDPIGFGDPTGMIEGLVGLLGSMSISNGQRGSKAGASFKVLNLAQRVGNNIEWIHEIIDLFFSLGSGNLVGVATKFLRIDPSEINAILQTLVGNNLTNIGLNTLVAGHITPVNISLPRAGKVGKAMEHITKLLGPNSRVQELLGEIAAMGLAMLMNFKKANLPNFPTVHGPDIFAKQINTSVWAMIEAKGGTSKLKRNTSHGPQMGWRWIDHWYERLARGNQFRSDDGNALHDDFFPKPNSKSIVAGVVSLNLLRATHQLKMAIQMWARAQGQMSAVTPGAFQRWHGF